MDRPKGNWYMHTIAVGSKLRDRFIPPERLLVDAGIRKGMTVLDFGCGPGSYTLPAAELVGNEGKVYAVDMHPRAITLVKKRAAAKKLGNITTIVSNAETGIPYKTVDMVLLYNVYRRFSEPGIVMVELHRLLKDDGILSFNDPCMDERDILSRVITNQLFRYRGKNSWQTYSFTKGGSR